MVSSSLLLEDLSLDEQKAVTLLKQRMIGYISQDMFDDVSVFVRFLRARDLNINAAEAMLKKHMEWRKANQIETILTDFTPKEAAAKYMTMNTMGLDKEGSPILYFHIGGLDSRGLFKSCRKSDVIRCIMQRLEENIITMKKQSYKLGKHIDKWTMVLNMENLSFAVATHKQTLEIVGTLITMYEANYPERLKIAYIINASLYFTMAFSVVKHFLSGPTFKKMHFFGKDGWREEMLKMIDIEVLPAFLGGKRTDPDGNPLCNTFTIHGGFVPESMFINKKEQHLSNDPGVEKVLVTRKSKAQLSVSVQESGSHIEWEFETKSRDIGFSLLYKKNAIENRAEELIPMQRIDTGLTSETGMYKCGKPGIYIIEFDNTYSWIHQKEIFYRLTVVKCPLING